MSTFYYDKFSQLDYYSQWLNYLENNSYIKDVTEAIDKSINEYSAIANIIMDNPQHRAYSLSNETVTESARQNAARIVGYVEQDSNIIRESLFNVGRMLHSCLSIIIDQQRVGQLLKENIALLLQFPDFQRERQYYIEQGFKYYINAAINIDLYKDALENLLQAEIREKTDYIMLHRIGMIYLYAFNVTNPPLAEDYFLRAARYAEMESNPGTNE